MSTAAIIDAEQVAELVDAGWSDRRIADRLGVSSRTVLRWRGRLGLASRWTPEIPPHGNVSRYRRDCRCSACVAANVSATAEWRRTYQTSTRPTAVRHRARWTPQDDAFLLEHTGTVAGAARALGRTYAACNERLRQLKAQQQ